MVAAPAELMQTSEETTGSPKYSQQQISEKWQRQQIMCKQ